MTPEALSNILASHRLWLANDPNGKRADLTRADLTRADLPGADLTGADLTGAVLRDADLRGAVLTGAKDAFSGPSGALDLAATRILPDSGDVTGWKKCRDGVLVQLRIPDGTARSHATGRKCRAASAVVLAVFGADVGVSRHDRAVVYRVGVSRHDRAVVYRVGETVTPREPFDPDWRNESASGIHFFITRAEAEAY